MDQQNDQRFEPMRAAEELPLGSRFGSFMGKRGAVRNNSGLPVHQSGPGLGRANNSINSQPKAGGLPSNLSQPKTGRELEGSALVGREAPVPSSLVPIRTNRNKPTQRKPLLWPLHPCRAVPDKPADPVSKIKLQVVGMLTLWPSQGETIQTFDSNDSGQTEAAKVHHPHPRPRKDRRRLCHLSSQHLQ